MDNLLQLNVARKARCPEQYNSIWSSNQIWSIEGIKPT